MEVTVWTRLSEKGSWWEEAVERKVEDESLQNCRADKCCLKSQRAVPAYIQTQAFPISCVTAQAVVSATGNRLRSLWKGSVSMLWMFINHYTRKSRIILIDYTGGRRGDWSGWRRVANNKPTCGFDCFHLFNPKDCKSAPKTFVLYISVKTQSEFCCFDASIVCQIREMKCLI